MARNLTATISRSAIRHNLSRVRQLAPGKKIIAMIKANGYGHGLSQVARAIKDVDAFGVATLEEGILLRESGIKTEVVLMEGVFKAHDLKHVEQYGFTLVVHAPYQIEHLKSFTATRPLPYWIKANSGMNRLGLPLSDVQHAYESLKDVKGLHYIGVMGHFPQADDTQDPTTLNQFKRFQSSTDSLPGLRSLANSATVLHWQDCHADWVRPGIMLFGASPTEGTTGQTFGLVPAMELSSEIIAIQDVHQGDKVGYGGTWTCDAPHKRIAIAAVGYGDGYPWHAQNGTPVLINSKKAPLVGRVSMDMIAIDISEIPKCDIGERVILWGRNLPIERVAQCANTIPYELFCRLTERVKMIWID